MFGGPFLGRTRISDGFPQNRIGALWATYNDRTDIESMVGTILALTTRAVKRYVLSATDRSQNIFQEQSIEAGIDALSYLLCFEDAPKPWHFRD